MAALTAASSLLSTLTTVASTVGAATTTAKLFKDIANPNRGDDLALDQLKARQRQTEQQALQNAAIEQQRIALQGSQDEEQRRAALRRAVARQRAQFGSSGVASGTGGSSDAVLLGLFDETEDELARRDELDNLRTRALDLGLTQQRSVNILQATQLAERQNINRLF